MAQVKEIVPLIWEIPEFNGLIEEMLADKEFTITGFLTETAHTFIEGRKSEKSWTLTSDNTKVAIKKIYEDVRENSFLTAIKKTWIWYNNDGSEHWRKVYIKPLSITQAADEEEARRSRQITYLKEAGKREGVGQHVNDLFKHYEKQIQSYIGNNGTVFKDALDSETNTQILTILNHVLEDGETVKESILKQIN